MAQNALDAAHAFAALPDPREMNPLQMAYLGDTLHDLYVRTRLASSHMSVGAMHRQAIRMVSASAQARRKSGRGAAASIKQTSPSV